MALLYQPLQDSSSFRVMVLQPGKWEDPINCYLDYTTLNTAPEYYALSYAWGSPRVTRPVIVNNMEMKVTVNLESALRYIRRRDMALFLWIDALCINQNDLKERECQVQIMRHIYACAVEVIVFLGDGRGHRINGHSKDLRAPLEVVFHDNDFDDNKHITDFVQRWTSSKTPPKATNVDVFSLTAILARGQENPFYVEAIRQRQNLEELFEALRMMLLSSWWSRIWVFQEAIVARRLTVRSGSLVCPWEMFVRAAVRYRDSPLPPLPGSCTEVLAYFSRLVEDIDTRREVTHTSTEPREAAAEILALLRATTKRRASDDRDKVYALLGLASMQDWLIPDYTLSVRDTYIKVSSQIIAQGKSLAPLYGDLGRKNRTDLPSWVPDWSAAIDDQELHRTKYTCLYNACGASSTQYIASALDLQRYMEKHGSGVVYQSMLDGKLWRRVQSMVPSTLFDDVEQFHIPGLFISTIFPVGAPFVGRLGNDQVHGICSLYTEYKSYVERSEEERAASLRALVFGLKYEYGKFRRLEQGDDGAIEEWLQSRLRSRFDVPDPLGLDTVVGTMAGRRRLFISNNSIGWGPVDSKDGDHVYILAGGHLPFVLRKTSENDSDKTFRLIGDCFIQDAMDGERCTKVKWDVAFLPLSSWRNYEFDETPKVPEIRTQRIVPLLFYALKDLESHAKHEGLDLISLV